MLFFSLRSTEALDKQKNRVIYIGLWDFCYILKKFDPLPYLIDKYPFLLHLHFCYIFIKEKCSKFLQILQTLDVSTLHDTTNVYPVFQYCPHSYQHCLSDSHGNVLIQINLGLGQQKHFKQHQRKRSQRCHLTAIMDSVFMSFKSL